MKARHLPVLTALLVAMTTPMVAQAADEVIAKARSFLGGDAALNAIQSVHFTGRLEVMEQVPSAADKTVLEDRLAYRPTEIIFQKPYRQKIIVQGPRVIETTALDGYDAWQKRTNPDSALQWQVTLLDANQVKRLRANTLENLSFYAIRMMPFCEVKLGDETTLDGRATVKLVFTHLGGIIFTRYFDKSTGRLIKTETENGSEIREEGEMFVQGVRFPKRVVNRSANGTVTAITFDQVMVNDLLPAEAFAVPSLEIR